MITRRTRSLDWIASELRPYPSARMRPGFRVSVDDRGRYWLIRFEIEGERTARGVLITAPHARTLLWFALTDAMGEAGSLDIRDQLTADGYFNLN